MDLFAEVAVILTLILANAVFALAEIAVVSARKPRLEAEADGGDRAARAVLDLKAQPDRFLSTVQVGNRSDRKSTRLNSSHYQPSRMPSSA